MSLVAQALCVIAQKLISGRTWAGDDVLLQPVDPIAEIMLDGREAAPVIAVYAEVTTFKIDGRATQGVSSSVELKIYVYCAPGVLTKTLENGGPVLEVSMDTATAGLTLNVLARQVDAAFHSDLGEWSDAWRKFVTRVERREVRYVLVEIENAVKIPTAEISYSVSAIPDPDFGAGITIAWQKLLAALSGSPDGAKLASLFRLLIENPAGLPDWQQFRDNFALTDEGLASTGVGPFSGVTLPGGSIPGFSTHTVTPDPDPIGG